jgi:RNA polymerase sigma factor (sigma-70 family)
MRETDAIDERMDVERALLELTDKQRAAVLLVMQGYTHREIAEHLGIARESVTLRLLRARNSYKTRLSLTSRR